VDALALLKKDHDQVKATLESIGEQTRTIKPKHGRPESGVADPTAVGIDTADPRRP